MVEFPGYSLSGMIASCFLILLTVKQQDDFRVLGPEGPILARVGEDALLTCRLLPKRSAAHMDVLWYRSEPRAAVTAPQGGADMVEVQVQECRGRLEMLEDGVAEGSVTLKIRSVQPSDSGQYWCRFQDRDYFGETSLLLQVAGLGSAPHIHIMGNQSGGVELLCTAEGWFPEPHVRWEDRWGERLLAVSEHHVLGEDGLFRVEDMLVVGNVSVVTETVSCFIHNPVLEDGKGAVLNLPEKLQTEMASLQVIGPSQPIPVRVGEDIQLTCYLSPKTNAQGMEVRWVRSLWYPAVYVHANGDLMAGEQMSEYRGRTSLVSDAIQEGKLTLQIHNARASDDGWYRCLFESDGVYQEASMELKVIAVGSTPLVTVERRKAGEKQLTCTSDGWFPQPHVQWKDTEGRIVPSDPAVLHQGQNGLFDVESHLLVTNSSVMNVACSISNLPLGEEKTVAVSLSESKKNFSWKMLPVSGLLLVVTIGLIWMKSCKKVSMTQDVKKAHVKSTLPGEHETIATCEHSYSQMSHRTLTASSTPRVRSLLQRRPIHHHHGNGNLDSGKQDHIRSPRSFLLPPAAQQDPSHGGFNFTQDSYLTWRLISS